MTLTLVIKEETNNPIRSLCSCVGTGCPGWGGGGGDKSVSAMATTEQERHFNLIYHTDAVVTFASLFQEKKRK